MTVREEIDHELRCVPEERLAELREVVWQYRKGLACEARRPMPLAGSWQVELPPDFDLDEVICGLRGKTNDNLRNSCWQYRWRQGRPFLS